jgi:ATP-dependent DNA helicase RecG
MNATWEHLDLARVINFLTRTRELRADVCTDSQLQDWLVNLDLGVIQAEKFHPTVAGILLFGKEPDQFLAHSRIKIIIYNTEEPSQDSLLMEAAGPLMASYAGESTQILTRGLIEKVLEIFDENFSVEEANTIGSRFPRAIVTELITNALVHRDYVNPEARIVIEIFPNHFEITSPGGLPTNQTATKVQAGFKVTQNQLLYNYLAESNYFQKNELTIFKLITMPAHYPQIKSFAFEPTDSQVKISCWLA